MDAGGGKCRETTRGRKDTGLSRVAGPRAGGECGGEGLTPVGRRGGAVREGSGRRDAAACVAAAARS